jgi:hypothetical protein
MLSTCDTMIQKKENRVQMKWYWWNSYPTTTTIIIIIINIFQTTGQKSMAW